MVLAQIRGFAENLWASITGATWEGFLPPSIVSTIKFLAQSVPDAFGFGSRQDQLRGSVVLIFVSLLSSVLTLGATLVFVGVFGFTLFVGVLRHIPAVDANWPLPAYEVFD